MYKFTDTHFTPAQSRNYNFLRFLYNFAGWFAVASIVLPFVFVSINYFMEGVFYRGISVKIPWFWIIIGALVFRAIFIFSGIRLIKMTYLPAFELFGYQFSLDQGAHPQPGFFFRPNLILTIFGAFLIYAGIKSLFDADDDDQKDYSKSLGARMVRKIFPVTKHYYGERFFVKRGTKRLATKLFLVLVVIETTDLIFAIDSIPAIFAIAPNDPLILYTSNIFAVLGLRSMYFLLANSIHMFSKLKYGLAFILSFIGVKMLLAPFFHIESAVSLSIVLGALLLSVCASIIWREESEEQTA